MRTCAVEVSQPLPDIDFTEADEWRVLVTLEGTPCAYLRLPSPGATSGGGMVDAAVARHADAARARREFVQAFRRRMGAPPPALGPLTCSVVVCTHRRPLYAKDALGAISRLEPAPHELIVVDNDPGELDCRAAAEEVGARYIREDRRGLNNARAAGLAAAEGEVVAFTDDDCLPARTWLRSLPELFDDRNVAAVTGPAFPHELDTPAQLRFQEYASFNSGLERQTLDWTLTPTTDWHHVGAGLNMIMRRGALEALEDPFPPELDAGTATQAGGDHYVLYKLLAAGHRVVYDPSTYVFHRHRRDVGALHDVVRGYGVAGAATLTKLLVEDRELAAIPGGRWLWRGYLRALLLRLVGQADPVEVRLGWELLRGALQGPGAWRKALGRAGGAPRKLPPRSGGGAPEVDGRGSPAPPHPAADGGADSPVISVIVPTSARSRALQRCLDGLARQSIPLERFEVIVVDDTPPELGRPAQPSVPDGLRVRTIATRGSGAPVARNAGARVARSPLILLLDDDVVPHPQLLERHLDRHGQSQTERIVVGCYPPRPRERTFAALDASLFWEDHFRTKRDAAALTFADVLTANMSIPRQAYDRLGGLEELVGRFRREDWEWGIRALTAGVEVVYEPEAAGDHEFSLDARGRVEGAAREAHGDAVILERYPFASAYFPQPLGRGWLARHPLQAFLYVALHHAAARRLALGALGLLERAKLRGAWLILFDLAQRGAYESSLRRASATDPRRPADTPVQAVELASQEPLPPPGAVPPILRLYLQGRPLGEVVPREGRWNASLAEQVADALPPECWGGAPLARPRPEPPVEGPFPETAVVVAGDGAVWGPEERRALEELGARVVALDPSADHWSAVDAALRECTEQIVAVLLPGVVPTPAWLSAVRPAMDGDRVAAAVGTGLEPGQAPTPLELVSGPSSYATPSSPPQYVAVRRDVYERLGGFDLAAAPLGPPAPVLDFVERALAAGFVVAVQDTLGLEPAAGSAEAQAQRERERARGGLVVRHALGIGGGAGLRWLASTAVAAPGVRWLWSALRPGGSRRAQAGLPRAAPLAFLGGCLTGLRVARRRVRRPR